MSDFQKKTKPTLASLLSEAKVTTGKVLIEQQKAKEKAQKEFEEAVEFELRNKKK